MDPFVIRGEGRREHSNCAKTEQGALIPLSSELQWFNCNEKAVGPFIDPTAGKELNMQRISGCR